MTVKELIELNMMIVDVSITVRTKDGKLVDQLNIGCNVGVKPPYPTRVPRDEKFIGSTNIYLDTHYKEAAYIPKSINSWDDERDYWQLKVNRIPEKWLELEVSSWEVWRAGTHGTSPRRDWNKSCGFEGQRINITALPNGQRLTVPEEKKEEPKSDDLVGQMTLEDFLESED